MNNTAWVVNKHISKVTSQENDTKLTFTRVKPIDEINQIGLRSRSVSIRRQTSPSFAKSEKTIQRTRSVSVKRKASPALLNNPKKIGLDMDTMNITDIIEKTTDAAVNKLKIEMKSSNEELVASFKAHTDALDVKIVDLDAKVDNFECKMDELSKKMDAMRQEITDEIACDLRTKLDNSRKENLRHSLLNEIEICNSNVIFYGYQGGGGHPF